LNLEAFYKKISFAILWLTPFISLNSQTISFKTNKISLYKNDFLSISITFSKDGKKEFNVYKGYQFPDIPDMLKSHTYFYEKEGVDKTYSIVQWYEPIRAGEKTIPSITIKTRNKTFTNPSFTIKVLNEITDQPSEPPSESWIAKTKLHLDEPDVKWQIYSDLQSLYPMQPIHIIGFVLLPLENKIPFTFADSHLQKLELNKKIKNSNCIIYDQLRSNELKRDTVVKNNQSYIRLFFIDQFLFPLRECIIQLPATEWYLYAYKTGTSDEGIVRLPEKVSLKSAPIKIKVVNLPPFPVKEFIPVGDFTIKDVLEQKRIRNGNATFITITMETNTDLSFAGEPEFISSDIELLGKETVSIETLNEQQWKVRKIIRYQINPLRSGQYQMSEAFRFIFFNTQKKQYDTIYPRSVLTVYGDRINESNAILTNDDFYNRYNSQANNKIIDRNQDDLFNRLANLIILVMLAVTAILIIRK
jgi:hypothetical protein